MSHGHTTSLTGREQNCLLDPSLAALRPTPSRRRGTRSAAVTARTALPLVLVAASLLALLAAVLLVKAGPASASDAAAHHRTPREMRIARVIRHMINKERAAHGLAPLTMRPDLLDSARAHDVAMMRADEMSHQLPGEPAFGARMDAAGYHWVWAGENIAWNSRMTVAGVAQLENLMYHEQAPNDGHRQNILNKHFVDVGVDVYMDHTHHKVWLTTDFGRR